MLLKIKKICYTTLFFAFICTQINAQKNSSTLKGKIYYSNKHVSDVHIINLNNRLGTVSNSDGEFEMNASLKDSLLISSIQYQSQIIGVTEEHLKSKIINIYLKAAVNELDEVFLHGLTGNLKLDLNSTPADTIPKHSFKYTPSDLNKKLPNDTHGFLSAPNARRMTDPTFNMGGSGASVGIPDHYMIALRKLKRELRSKKAFPIKIRKELGLEYFTKVLKIPEDRIDHFLAFCESRNIIEYYSKNNLLEVIKILQEESKNYYEIKH